MLNIFNIKYKTDKVHVSIDCGFEYDSICPYNFLIIGPMKFLCLLNLNLMDANAPNVLYLQPVDIYTYSQSFTTS